MAGAGIARDLALRGRVGGPGREGRLRLRHHLPLLEADPRRAPLPRAVRLRPRARVAAGAGDTAAAGPAPGAAAARSWCPSTGSPRAASSRCASASGSTTGLRPGASASATGFSGPRRPRPGAGLRAPTVCAAPATTSTICWSIPERLCLENALSACRHGARVVNYAEVEEVVRGADGAPAAWRARSSDRPGGHPARAGRRQRHRTVGGPVSRAGGGVRPGAAHRAGTKGIHCLLPRLTERAIYHSTADDRMIFVIPWRDFSLVGTTDTDFDGDLDRVHATRRRGRPICSRRSAGSCPVPGAARRGRLHVRRGAARSPSRRARARPTSRGSTRSSTRRTAASSPSPAPS